MKQTLTVYSKIHQVVTNMKNLLQSAFNINTKVITTVNYESQYHNKKSSGQVVVGC